MGTSVSAGSPPGVGHASTNPDEGSLRQYVAVRPALAFNCHGPLTAVTRAVSGLAPRREEVRCVIPSHLQTNSKIGLGKLVRISTRPAIHQQLRQWQACRDGEWDSAS